jgi:ribosomal protein S28E/S33
MRLPQANARLTAVTGRGYSEDWDAAGTAGSTRWSGQADAYVQTQAQEVRDGGRDSTVITRSVVLPSEVPVEVGDTLALTYRETAVSWPVVSVIARTGPAGVRSTTLVEVEPG